MSASNQLHQQDGGMSPQAFAEQEGLSLDQIYTLARRGLILGARKDSRSKKWWIYPPAKVLESARSYTKRNATGAGETSDTSRATAPEKYLHPWRSAPLSAAALPDLLPRGSADTGEAGAESGQSGQYAPQVEAAGARPSAKPVLTLDDAALPVAARTKEHGASASCGKPDVYTEARSVCQALHDAAVRQYREGIHYLRLNAHELAQLYAALDNDRSRVRKLVGKGLLPVGLLRASDTVWQKMQAMCREGRLL